MAQLTDLQRAYAALTSKRMPYTKNWNYYHNQAPLVYTNDRLREVFANLDARFTENWAAVVVDSACDRINLEGFQTNDTADQALLSTIWQNGDLSIVADDVHEAALVCGEAFVIAWPNAQGDVKAYYNDPRLCHVFYDEEDPYTIAFAAKWYDRGSGGSRMVLYYPDRVDYYVAAKPVDQVAKPQALVPDNPPTVDNPFNMVPVFHFRMRRDARSELENVIPLQNGVNKLLADMMVAAEFGAYRQRWVIANGDLTALKNAPNEIWQVPAGDGAGQQTTIGEFGQTDLKVYIEAIDRSARAIGIISRTPKHYFFAQGGDPSGEALMAMEAPLIRKVQDYIGRFTPTWRNLGGFLLKLSGSLSPATSLTPHFQAPETVQPLTQAQTRQANTGAGIPIKTVLRKEGWSEQDLAQLDKDKKEAGDAQQASMAAALVEAQRRLDQGGDNADQVSRETSDTGEAPSNGRPDRQAPQQVSRETSARPEPGGNPAAQRGPGGKTPAGVTGGKGG